MAKVGNPRGRPKEEEPKKFKYPTQEEFDANKKLFRVQKNEKIKEYEEYYGRKLNNEERYELGLRKSTSGQNYEPKYKKNGAIYIKSQNQKKNGHFKKGNTAGSIRSKKLNQKDFKKQMSQVSRDKATLEDVGEIVEQLLSMSKEGNINAIRMLKEFWIGKEGFNNTLDVKVDSQIVWEFPLESKDMIKEIEDNKSEEENIIDADFEDESDNDINEISE